MGRILTLLARFWPQNRPAKAPLPASAPNHANHPELSARTETGTGNGDRFIFRIYPYGSRRTRGRPGRRSSTRRPAMRATSSTNR